MDTLKNLIVENKEDLSQIFFLKVIIKQVFFVMDIG